MLSTYASYSLTATAFGDPHFVTFDGTNYTFNPHGEFWLVKVDEQEGYVKPFRLQARMEIPSWAETGDVAFAQSVFFSFGGSYHTVVFTILHTLHKEHVCLIIGEF